MDHVILIHGTFARGASWTMPDSPLQAVLIEATAGRAGVHRFDWSGKNSFAARLRATEELVAFMNHIAESDLDARFHLLAHSHGGNVALHASRSDAVTARINSISCLGTPVLVGREVAPTKGLEAAYVGLFLMSGVLSYAAFDLSLWRNLSLWWLVPLVALGLLFGTMLLINIATLVSPLHVGSLQHGMHNVFTRQVQMVLLQTASPKIESDRVMFFRHPGDEASAASGPIQILNWILGRASMLLEAYHLQAEKWFMQFAEVSWRFYMYCFYYLVFIAFLGIASRWLLLAGVLLPVACIGVVLVLPILLHSIRLFANVLLALFFGSEMVFAGYRVQVTAEATPSGSWQVTLLNRAPSRIRRVGVLPRTSLSDVAYPYAHGRVYSDPNALSEIGKWLRACLTRPRFPASTRALDDT